MNELSTTNHAIATLPDQDANWNKLKLMLKYSKLQIIFSICLILNGISFVCCMVYWVKFNTTQITLSFVIPLIIWLVFAVVSNLFENKYTNQLKTLGIIFAERKALYKLNHKITMCAFLLGLFSWFITIKLFLWTKSVYQDAKKHLENHQPFFIDIRNDPNDDGSIGGPTIWNWI